MLTPGCPRLFSDARDFSAHQVKAAHPAAALSDASHCSREEMARFPAKEQYLSTRKLIMDMWAADPTQYLTLKACLDGQDGEVDVAAVTAVHAFLMAHGRINFGSVLPPAADPPAAGEVGETKPPEDVPPPGPSTRTIVLRLYEILRTIDFSVATEKTIRKQLEDELGCSLQEPDMKALVKKHVVHVIQNMDTRETLEPIDLPTDDADSTKADDVSGGTKPPRKVIVVGAGAAGLAAASTIQKCGIEVVVLEASNSVGGRFGPPPVDSETTSLSSSLGPELWLPGSSQPTFLDPIQILAKQLGLSLEAAPGSQGGAQLARVINPQDGSIVSSELMAAAEKLRDELIAEVKAASSKSSSSSSSLGEALRSAITKRRAVASVQVKQHHEAKQEADTKPAVSTKAENGEGRKAGEGADKKPAGSLKAEDGEDTKAGEEADEKPAGSVMAEEGVAEEGVKVEGQEAATSAAAAVELKTAAPATATDADADAAAAAATAAAAAACKLEHEALDWLLQLLEHAAGAPLDQLPVSFLSRQFYDPAHLQTQLTLSGPSGLPACGRLLQGLSTGLDIRLGDAVRSVTYSKQGVSLTTKSGQVFEAAAAVIAVPLSTLRNSSIAFDPPMPNWKSSAMNRLSLGSHVTAVVHFTSPFWNSSRDEKGADDGDEGCMGVGAMLGALPSSVDDVEPRPFMFQVLSLTPPTLAAVFARSQAPKALEASDSELSSIIQISLGQMFPNRQDAQLDATSCHVARWSDSSSACGLTYLGLGAAEADISATAMPLKHTLCFAGGHTVVGTAPSGELQSALASGLREAARCCRIVSLLDASSAHDDASLEVGEEAPSAEQLAAYKERAKQVEREAKEAASRAQKEKRKKGGSEDEEDEEEEDEDDEDDEGDAPKKKRKTKEPSAKAARKPSKRKKQADGSDEDGGGGGGGSADEGDPRASKTAKAKKPRKTEIRDPRDGAPGSLGEYDPQKAARELQRREGARQEKKQAHKAMIQAQSGNLTPLWELMMGSSDNLDMQQHMVHVLTQATVDVLDTVAVDGPILKILAEWLTAFCAESSAEHLVCAIIRLLKKLPCTLDVLKSSGVAMSVRRNCLDHKDKELRRTAEELMQTWMRGAPGGRPQPTNGSAKAPPATAPAAKKAAAPAAASRPVASAAVHKATPASADAGASAGPASTTHQPGPAPASGPLTEEDRMITAQIKATEAQIAAAEAETARLAVVRAQRATQAKKAVLPKMSTFDEFRKSSKAPSKSTHHSHVSSSGAAEGAGGEDPLAAYVKQLLHYHVKKGAISKEQSQKIQEKSIRKMKEHEEKTGAKIDMSREGKKATVRKCVEGYVLNYSTGQ